MAVIIKFVLKKISKTYWFVPVSILESVETWCRCGGCCGCCGSCGGCGGRGLAVGPYARRLGLGSGSGVVGVVCCRANNDTRIWFFWHKRLCPRLLLVAGLVAVEEAVDDAAGRALEVTCFIDIPYILQRTTIEKVHV